MSTGLNISSSFSNHSINNMVLMDYDEPKPSKLCNSNGNGNNNKKLYAKAIYDNMADSTDELAFRRGDILTVVEQNTNGLEGWWLCQLRGRQGICPGNRLKLIPAHDSGCYSPSPLSSPCPSLGTISQISAATTPTASTPQSDFYENTGLNFMQKQGKRRSWHIMPNKVITPQKCGDVYLYDLLPTPIRGPPSSSFSSLLLTPTSMSSDQDAYDIPKPATPVNYDMPRPMSRSTPIRDVTQARGEESYDIPRPVTNLLSQHNSTPSSSNSSLLTSDFSMSSSNRSSLAMPDYDIPRRNPQGFLRQTPPPPHTPGTPLSTYDTPHHMSSSQLQQVPQQTQHIACSTKKELPLELSSALETLDRLQTEATTAVTRLLSFVCPNWRLPEKLDPVLMDLKLAAVRLRTALHDLSEFGEGALGNAAKADDKNIATKLRPLVKALKDADKLIHDASHNLDIVGWTVDTLQRTSISASSNSLSSPDSLDQLIACAQTLTDDVRQTASFIQGNATLLFKRQGSSPTTPTGNNNGNGTGEWLEDYDYVSLETKEALAKKNAEIRDALPQDLQKNFENIVKNAESACNEKPTELDPNDKSLLIYYTTQTVTHMGYLQQAIDAFLETVERNQPPKIFLAYGKFVVLSAHNLVNIGDIVHRNVSLQNVKTRVLSCADALSDALKQCVTKTKKAAQHFPSVTAVQEMVDSVVDISHLARDLKIAMLQTVAPTVMNQQ
uniref:Breast cancer anti-estrogen resistance protein 1 n=1 Tax=Culicoides sonorensis TaxID=179676 RepID=A0A336LZY3_CULSO